LLSAAHFLLLLFFTLFDELMHIFLLISCKVMYHVLRNLYYLNITADCFTILVAYTQHAEVCLDVQ